MQKRSKSTMECTECGETYTTLTQSIKRTIKRFDRYVCPDCAKLLAQEKRKEAFIRKYGVDNPMKDEKVREKVAKTHLEHYGYSTPFANPEVKKKIKEDYKQKTGYDNPAKNPESKKKSKKTCLERYGVEYPLQNPDIRKKIMHTAYENDTIPTSKPQLKCFQLLEEMGYDVTLNFLVGPLSLDVLIKANNTLIDFEYDGWYWHQDKQKDCARNAVLMKLGYKIFRIKAFSDIIPSKEMLQEGIETLLNTNKKVFYREIGKK